TGNQITLSAWVKSTADQNDDAGIVIKNVGSIYNYNLNVQSNERGNFRVTTPSKETYITGATDLQQDQWYFLYGIYNGATAKVYLNSIEDGSDTNSGNILSTTEPVLIGRRAIGDNRFFEGTIDEVRISSTARSTDWMTTEYNNQQYPDKAVHGNDGFFTLGSEEEAP
ncbi:LamG domain-containing protein, partial [Chloroflexota bacterium]